MFSKNRKSLQTAEKRQADGSTDDGRHAIRKAHLNFQLEWAKNGNRIRNQNNMQR